MGRVFSPEAVANYAIPTPDLVEEALLRYGKTVTDAVNDGSVISSVIYGSVAAGTHNIRSDLDCILVHDGTVEGWNACKEIIMATTKASEGTLPIESPPYPRYRISQGLHEIDPHFGYHLTTGRRIVHGEDIATYIQYPETPILLGLSQYLAAKKASIDRKAASPFEHDRLRALQRTLEAPLAVGRKVLKAVDSLQGTDYCPEDTANKDAVANASLMLFSELGAREVPFSVLCADTSYNEKLKEAIEGKRSLLGYMAVLNELEGLVQRVSMWIDTVQFRLPVYVNHARSKSRLDPLS